MAITGAIFDCDGTLVDSMPMWHRVLMELLERHQVDDPQAVYDELEPLSCDEMCETMHERFGMGESGRALYEELMGAVRHEYATSVKAYPGVRELLAQLHEAGIPMVVGSSTPADAVRVALRAQGIERYFQDVIFAGDVGRSKDFPDIYEEALRRLGTDKASTWVFEDAPFALRTARTAGFPTVCIYNGHDGRDEAFLRRYACIFSHEYVGLTLALIRDYAEVPTEDGQGSGDKDERPLVALVVDGSPEPSSAALVGALARAADYVIAADRGAERLHEAGAAPDVFCGDADSVSAGAASWARGQAATDIRFPSDKYATDLALAIDCARHEAARQGRPLELQVTCATGGRPDHQLAVMGLLAASADARPRLIEDGFECRILSPRGRREWRLCEEGGDACGRAAAAGATFSAIAVTPGTVVSEKGSKWELDRHALGLLEDMGISNEVGTADCRVICEAGAVAVFLDVGRR